jgi:diacylglycerol kinase family enzyme
MVFNPFATSTSESTLRSITSQLSQAVDLTVKPTKARADAIEFGRCAQADGYDIVIGYGGDGTVNELANGLLHAGPNPSGPILATLPGGNANVFARNLAYSADPMIATEQLLDAIAMKRTRRVGVGSVVTDEFQRWFLFNAGFGIDADVLAAMDERRQNGKRASDITYTMIAIRKVLAAAKERNPTITLETDSGEVISPLQFALVINVAPWIYLGSRAVTLAPEATHEKALSLFAANKLSIGSLSKVARDVFRGADVQPSSQVTSLSDLSSLALRSEFPLWLQTDGEVLSQVANVSITHSRDALTVFS